MKQKLVLTTERYDSVTFNFMKTVDTHNTGKIIVEFSDLKGVLKTQQIDSPALFKDYTGVENKESMTFTVLDKNGDFVCSIQEKEVFELDENDYFTLNRLY